mmetsp:Transcript_14360/g.23754  ORF Transcript_14360/g.23754 Transcript_14360/m.23754 type:complete len:430 (+) Transcript_14360:267-1556(+)
MPIFFLLSGFSMAVCYGKNSAAVENNKLIYYQNRFARVYPVYLVTNLLALPRWFYGFGLVPSSQFWGIVGFLTFSIIPVSSWITAVPINEPGWTVATLVFMWMLFPFHIRSLRELSNRELLSKIVHCFYVQLLWGWVTMIVLQGIGMPWLAFQVSTMHPIGRYPVFVMGVCGGLLALRQSTALSSLEADAASGPSCSLEQFPLDAWPKSYMSIFPRYCTAVPTNSDGHLKSNIGDHLTPDSRRSYWTKRTDDLSLHVLCLTLFIILVDAIARYVFGVEDGIVGNFWLQLFVPFLQLEIVLGLSLQGDGDCRVRSFLMNDVVMWCGKMSMVIYLIHLVVLYYICLLLNHGQILHWPFDNLNDISHENCEDDYENDDILQNQCEDDVDEFYRKRLIPMWALPVVMAVSLLLSPILFHGLEEPLRKALRARK